MRIMERMLLLVGVLLVLLAGGARGGNCTDTVVAAATAISAELGNATAVGLAAQTAVTTLQAAAAGDAMHFEMKACMLTECAEALPLRYGLDRCWIARRYVSAAQSEEDRSTLYTQLMGALNKTIVNYLPLH